MGATMGRSTMVSGAGPGGTALLVTRSGRDGCVLVHTILGRCSLLRTRSNGRTIQLCHRRHPSLVLVSLGVPSVSKCRTAIRVEGRSSSVPVVTMATFTFSRSRRQMGRGNFGKCTTGPVGPTRLGGVVIRCLSLAARTSKRVTG